MSFDGSVILDERARQAAAMVMTAAERVLYLFGLGYAGAEHPTHRPNWPNDDLYKGYMALYRALAEGRRFGLDRPPFTFEQCQGCRNFTAIKSGRADKAPEPVDGVVESGFCAAHPPTKVTIAGRAEDAISMWPAVHPHQSYGQFTPITSRRLKFE